MSAYTTIKIRRSKARVMAVEAVMNASDEILENIMDDILRERLYNCRVVEEDAANDEAEAGL
jgi:DNA-binding TFAR19-related protein (PDSD5 family)